MSDRSILTPNSTSYHSSYLTTSQAGQLVGLNKRSIYNTCKAGYISYVQTLGKHLRVSRDSLLEYYGLKEPESQNIKETSKISVLCRCSDQSQTKRGSLERQKNRVIEELIKRNINPDSVNWYMETCSCYSFRPVLAKLLESVISGETTTIISENEQRFSRLSCTTSIVSEICRVRGCEIIYLDKTENQDSLEEGLQELINHAGIICAKQNGRRSTLVTKRNVSPKVLTFIIDSYNAGITIRNIHRLCNSKGFKSSVSGVEYHISYNKILRLLDIHKKLLRKPGDSTIDELFLSFCNSHIIKDVNKKLCLGDVYGHYVKFCKSQKKTAYPKTVVGRSLKSYMEKIGIKRIKSVGIYTYQGVSLVNN